MSSRRRAGPLAEPRPRGCHSLPNSGVVKQTAGQKPVKKRARSPNSWSKTPLAKHAAARSMAKSATGSNARPLTKQLVKHALCHLHVARARARRDERGRSLRVGRDAEAAEAGELLDGFLELALRAERLDAARGGLAGLPYLLLVGQLCARLCVCVCLWPCVGGRRAGAVRVRLRCQPCRPAVRAHALQLRALRSRPGARPTCGTSASTAIGLRACDAPRPRPAAAEAERACRCAAAPPPPPAAVWPPQRQRCSCCPRISAERIMNCVYTNAAQCST